MYFVTYRNVLQQGKTFEDYRKGFTHVWQTLRREWGATHIEMYRPLYDESGAFYSRYTIQSLDTWNENLQSPRFAEMLRHLGSILDLTQSQVEVSVVLETGVT